jgi:hypothetical protein
LSFHYSITPSLHYSRGVEAIAICLPAYREFSMTQ